MADKQCQQQPFHANHAQEIGTRDHAGVATQHHQQNTIVSLHAGKKDNHQPEVAQGYKVGQHQQPINK